MHLIFGSCWTIQLPPRISTKWGAHTQWFVTLSPKPYGNGPSPWISGYLQHMSLVHKTSQNQIADFKSCHFDENTELSLSPILFAQLSQVFYIPQVDLFARRSNRQVETFASWEPESEAWDNDAFSISWRDIKFYAFPPFSAPSRVLSKIKEDKTCGILVMPLWPTHPWFPVMLDHPRHIKPDLRNLQVRGNPLLLHPLHKRSTVLVTFISSMLTNRGLSKKSTELLSHAWREGTKNYTTPQSEDGEHIEVINFMTACLVVSLPPEVH